MSTPASPQDLDATHESPPAISNFIRKLYQMLQDSSSDDIVSWSPGGDCFIVKDVQKLTTLILPEWFKHGNFSSFVRQLNKYGFHKVRSQGLDESGCIFRHPDFNAKHIDTLSNIKRKDSNHKEATISAPPSSRSSGTPPQNLGCNCPLASVQDMVDALTSSHLQLLSHIDQQYSEILSCLRKGRNSVEPSDFAHACGELSPFAFKALSAEDAAIPAHQSKSLSPFETATNDEHIFQQLESTIHQQSSPLSPSESAFSSTWALPPYILVVDDDPIQSRLSCKMLQSLGCLTDVAFDGQDAVEKMTLGHYDLILMDIMMPKLNGNGATAIIRGFDDRTPIISMTASSQPRDVMSYFKSGMNDILPKPFTKEGLAEVLYQYLGHLLLPSTYPKEGGAIGESFDVKDLTEDSTKYSGILSTV